MFEVREWYHPVVGTCFYICDEQPNYVWHDKTIHSHETAPTRLDSINHPFEYGYWHTGKEAQNFLDEWSKTHDKY